MFLRVMEADKAATGETGDDELLRSACTTRFAAGNLCVFVFFAYFATGWLLSAVRRIAVVGTIVVPSCGPAFRQPVIRAYASHVFPSIAGYIQNQNTAVLCISAICRV